jgi:anhydro-N-acetylmuramic acid kinase
MSDQRLGSDGAEHPIVRLLGQRTKRVVGLMSGTSLDGVDAALVEIEGFGPQTRARLLAFESTPYSADEREALHRLFDADTRAVCEGSFRFGERLAQAALDVIARAGLRPRDIDLIGSHGQTIWHQPPSQCSTGGTPSTLQIGEPAVIAARTGVLTVADFRVADVALGGEGAPLVPWVDWALFREAGRTRALQNIGGIANVTLVTEAISGLLAFDNGPGNMMIDALAQAATHGAERFDRDGAFSARGRVQDDILTRLLDDDYLRQPPPKSTGRERYGVRATEALRAAHPDRSLTDLLATAVAFTARAIADSYRAHLLPRGLDEVLVSGGGAHNRTLMAHLERLLAPLPVRPFDGGIGADAKEAVAFAVLAVQALHGASANVPQVTGAARTAILGKICLP